MGRDNRDDTPPATGLYRYPPWWKRIYFDKTTLIITLGVGVLSVVKVLLTGTLFE